MLWRPGDHATLTDREWDAGRVQDAIQSIVADVERAYRGDELWPAHESDAPDGNAALATLYIGAAGVVWALDALRRRGRAEVGLDLERAAARALSRCREEPDFVGENLPTPAESSLLCGETGVLLVAYRLAPDAARADRLFELIGANARNESNELSWGSPGTMLAARAMHAWTGELRWLDAWTVSADELLARREADGLWTQQAFGRTLRMLGSAHGAAGNQLALLQGELGDESATGAALTQTAMVEDGLANWPREAGHGRDDLRVQWCHGAPGIVISASSYLDDELVLAASELVWRAGPMGDEKGACICHGTAGNGYAFLKTFERTNDERWLDRARRFAMHALEQVELRGRSRYSLFTGDLGVALYAADCLDARAAYPVLDPWD
jgi:Lanthionine synthetase C-like protein